MTDDPPLPPDSIFCIRRAQAGDQDVWDQLRSKVAQVVHRRLDRRDLPSGLMFDDVVQMVLWDVWRGRDAFDADDPQASFRGWVATLLRRRLADEWRRIRAKKRGGGHELLMGDYEQDNDRTLDVEDQRLVRQSQILLNAELQACIEERTAKMPAKDREVLRLREGEQMSFAEIAAAMGYDKEVTVRARYHHACKRREKLVRPCLPPSTIG